ncbi:ATP synthase F1 subunit delta [Candidatus Gottesmanbacteria bacterium]|nr:ATP synthase F1 subunit delta [Candidatus Gottesmanbacteria bacterium]
MKKLKKPNLVVAGLLDYLEETGQRQLLPEVTSELEKLLREAKEAQAINITSSVPLTQSQSEKLEKILEKLLKSKLPMVKKVDKNLLGGLTIKVGDWFLDASLRQQLAYLKKYMLS